MTPQTPDQFDNYQTAQSDQIEDADPTTRPPAEPKNQKELAARMILRQIYENFRNARLDLSTDVNDRAEVCTQLYIVKHLQWLLEFQEATLLAIEVELPF